MRSVPVIYVGGTPRSGSTLLDLLLGQVPGICAAGEVEHLWERGVAENQLCGCGARFHDCPFWHAVMARAFGGLGRVDAEAIRRLQRGVLRMRYLPYLVSGVMPRQYRERVAAYGEILTAVYRAITEVSGCGIVADSSKSPAYGFLLRAIPSVDLRVVHLVRDSRAVAFSYRRRKQRPEIHWQTEYMLQYTPWASARLWTLWNLLTAVLRARAGRGAVLRYEDLAACPRDTMDRVLREVADAPAALDFIDGHTVHLQVSHTAAGNPMRFERGNVEIRVDEEWRRGMPGAQRGLVTLLTWPMLLGYHYPWR